jgi:hypothetical protein
MNTYTTYIEEFAIIDDGDTVLVIDTKLDVSKTFKTFSMAIEYVQSELLATLLHSS